MKEFPVRKEIEGRHTYDLRAHPLNKGIYREKEINFTMRDSIKEKGVLVPLIVTLDNRIVSGHSRWKIAKVLHIDELPVQVLDTKDEMEIEACLVHANRQRDKTNEQKAREFKKLKKIEKERAKKRLAESARRNQPQNQSPENLPESEIAEGDARDIAAEAVGMSGKTAEHAEEVVDEIDALEADGKQEEADKLREVLNEKSVHKAHQEVKGTDAKPEPKPKPASVPVPKPEAQPITLTDADKARLGRMIKEWQQAGENVKAAFLAWVETQRAEVAA